jgi:para-nitrobenzyl esterase
MEFKEIGESRCAVKTDAGLVEGVFEDGIWRFLGIPYARPPLGGLRWKPPQPVPAWEGVRPCAQFGDSCPQPESDQYGLGGLGEDCLHLNIWVPRGSAGERLPVMVWIHGGAFLTGSSSVELHRDEALYDGSSLARQGVIVVTMNYRLGPFGFFAHPILAGESSRGLSGNYGLLDQLAALAWVRRNISSFGGDESRLTLFGQSAGASSICYLMVNPLAEGSFERAIIESAPFWIKGIDHPEYQSMEAALENGKALVRALGLEGSPRLLEEMRSRTYEEIIAAAGMGVGLPIPGIHFGPAIDGWLLPDRPEALLAAGEHHAIDVIAGSTRSEALLMSLALAFNVDEYEGFARSIAEPLAVEALRLFPASSDEQAPRALNGLITALEFTAPARFAARCAADAGAKAFLYNFSPNPTNESRREVCACHGSEIPYVFGRLSPERGYDSRDMELSSRIMDYWTNFARGGDPNGPGLPAWPRYAKESDLSLELGYEIAAKSGLEREACDLAERIHGVA